MAFWPKSECSNFLELGRASREENHLFFLDFIRALDFLKISFQKYKFT